MFIHFIISVGQNLIYISNNLRHPKVFEELTDQWYPATSTKGGTYEHANLPHTKIRRNG